MAGEHRQTRAMHSMTAVRLKAGAGAAWRRQLAHRLTMEDEHAAGRAPSGVTVWAAWLRERQVVVSWRWVMVEDGIPVVADPLGIWSNIEFVDGAAQPLRAGQALLELGSLVCALPWQERVPRRRPLSGACALQGLAQLGGELAGEDQVGDGDRLSLDVNGPRVGALAVRARHT